MAQQIAGLASVLQNLKMPTGVNPVNISLPSPPRLEGPLSPNNWLTKAQRRAENKVLGPESMVVYKGHVYTGQADGWVVQVKPDGDVRKIRRMSMDKCGQTGAGEDACGRPLGMRVDNAGYLVVADAYNGIIRINPQTGQYKHLVNSRTLQVNGKPLGYINDLTISKGGTIFFTSSSTKWTYLKESNIIFEAENSGRVLFYNPRETRSNMQVQELVTELRFPNGIELTEDENSLLIAEGARSRILRAWIGPDHPKRGSLEVFADNLPGVVDNIRRSPRKTYWVGIAQSRHYPMPSVLDIYGDNAKIRGALISMVNRNVKFDNPKFGIALELSGEGKIVRSLQDPYGKIYTSVSQVSEEDGLLYIASPVKKFVGILNLQNMTRDPPTNPVEPSTNSIVEQFLARVRRNMLNMTVEKVKQAVLELVRELFMSRRYALYLNKLGQDKQKEIDRLRQLFSAQQNGSSGGGSRPGGDVTPAAPGGSGSVTASPSFTFPPGPSTTSGGGGAPLTQPGTTSGGSGSATSGSVTSAASGVTTSSPPATPPPPPPPPATTASATTAPATPAPAPATPAPATPAPATPAPTTAAAAPVTPGAPVTTEPPTAAPTTAAATTSGTTQFTE
ncbi:adipocyte plasma membrane-associated protein-like [Littorina saxatilis]|uniref:adipocyte plasma membrane-associated protein-like n=1 Tax=Littorina saxatilis TaxID=31220 RepID=UPI0038B61CBC